MNKDQSDFIVVISGLIGLIMKLGLVTSFILVVIKFAVDVKYSWNIALAPFWIPCLIWIVIMGVMIGTAMLLDVITRRHDRNAWKNYSSKNEKWQDDYDLE